MIIFHNPQSAGFGDSIIKLITGIRGASKYNYLIHYALKNNIKIGVYLQKYSLISTIIIIPIYFSLCFMNKYNIFKIKLFFTSKHFTKQDKLLTFFWSFNPKFIKKNINTKMIIHTTHFHGNISHLASDLKKIKNYSYIGETNLLKNSLFFSKYFDGDKDFFVLPFTFGERFKKVNKNFQSRKLKCFATGSFNLNMTAAEVGILDDYKNFFGEANFQPMRKKIYENKDKINNYIDSFITDTTENKKSIKINKGEKGFISDLKAIMNGFIFGRNKKYFSFNIVEKYNEYTMFIAPEEIIGLPSINMVEGMACGCAYIGVEGPIYSDYGMISGEHYIGYDGTLDGLIKKIEYYQNHKNELEEIANNGYIFAINNFNGETNAKKFFDHFK